MQMSERPTNDWPNLIGALLARARLAPLLPRFLLISWLVIAVCGPQSTQVANAQDGGSGSGPSIQVTFALDIAPLSKGRMCLGHTETLLVNPKMNIMVRGEATVGRVKVHVAGTSAGVLNPAVVEATTNSWKLETSPNAAIVPFGASLTLTGRAAGSTTVIMTATIETDAFLQYDEEVVLPIPSSTQVKASIDVQVVPCRYRVDILWIWPTSMYGASSFVTASIINEELTSSGGTMFSHVPRSNSPSMRWRAIHNRIRGCMVTNVNWSAYPPQMSAEISDGRLYVSLFFSRSVPDAEYYNRLCPVPPGVTQGYCPGYPDGICWVKDGPPADWFEPQAVTEPIIFSLDGGTQPVRQILRHVQGNAQGGMNITLTPLQP